MSFPRYPRYKDSGVEWLGEVPAHWSLKPLWTFFRRVKRMGFEDEQLLSVYRDHGVVPKASRDDNFNKPSEDLSTYQLVTPGDLAINKMKAWQGSVAISEHRGIVSPAYFVYQALHTENRRYLHYLMRSLRYITGYLTLSKGIRVNQWDLEPQLHSRMPLVVPPALEQAAIAAFLERETAKIDALVAEQRRLIELLKENRQTVISHAVTKGLNPDAPMRPSGVEWLGELPAHWEVWKLAHAFTVIGSGTTPSTANPDFYDDGDVPWINTSDLNDGELDTCGRQVTAHAVATHGALKLYPAGSLVIAMYGATVGKVAILRFPATVNQACCVFAGDSPISAKFMAYWFIGMRQQIVSLATGGGQPNISQEILRMLRVACPDGREQASIVAYLDEETTRIDTLISEAQRAIALLQERRTTLISAAVTGQIDVRGIEDRVST